MNEFISKEAPKWTPASRPPEYDGLYIVTLYSYEGNKPKYLTTSATWWRQGRWLAEGVTAWMELPKAYDPTQEQPEQIRLDI